MLTAIGRHLPSFTLLLVLMLAPLAAIHAQSLAQIDIPAQALADSLRALGSQTKLTVVFDAQTVAGRSAPAVNARLSVDEAFQRLLQGTGLRHKFLDDKTVVLTSASSTAPTAENATESRDGLRVAQSSMQKIEAARDLPSASFTQQSQDDDENTVVVTAQKRVERLLDVPVPVTALNASSLVSNNQLRLQDYYTKVPGLNFSMDNRGAPSMSIRGITTGAFVAPTIGFTVDEVPYGSSVVLSSFSPAPDIDPNELAGIEVLRGPQGTLYGANSMGGLIKYITIDPSTQSISGRLQLGTNTISNGDDIGYSASGAINVPLSDTAAIRASAFSRRDPGFIDNVLTGEDEVNETQVDGVRVSTLWRASDALSVRMSALLQRSQADGASQIHPGLGEWEQAYLGGLGGYDRKLQAYSLNLAGTAGKAEFTSITGYNIGHTEDSYDVTSGLGGATDLFYGVGGVAWSDADNKTRNLSQELRLVMPLSSRIDWLLGAFYTDQRTDQDGGFVLVDPVTFVPGQQISRQRIDSSYKEYALFTDFTLRITDQFDVQVGGRQSHNKQTSVNNTTGVPPLFGDSLQPRTDSSDDSFTYLLTPRFKISPDFMTYARFASGYRPGGPNVSAAGIPPSFGPDRTRNYEAGAKAQLLDQRLFLDASVYYIDWRDIQITQMQPAAPFLGYSDNASRARSRGIELTMDAHPADATSISIWAAWNDSELTEALPVTSTFPGGSGDRLPYSTRFSGTFSIEQSFPLGALTGVLAGSANYVGEREGEFSAVRQVYPSYTRVDLRTGVRAGAWSANLFVNNAMDKRGALSGGAGIFPFAFTYIQPRTVGISVARTFQ